MSPEGLYSIAGRYALAVSAGLATGLLVKLAGLSAVEAAVYVAVAVLGLGAGALLMYAELKGGAPKEEDTRLVLRRIDQLTSLISERKGEVSHLESVVRAVCDQGLVKSGLSRVIQDLKAIRAVVEQIPVGDVSQQTREPKESEVTPELVERVLKRNFIHWDAARQLPSKKVRAQILGYILLGYLEGQSYAGDAVKVLKAARKDLQ